MAVALPGHQGGALLLDGDLFFDALADPCSAPATEKALVLGGSGGSAQGWQVEADGRASPAAAAEEAAAPALCRPEEETSEDPQRDKLVAEALRSWQDESGFDVCSRSPFRLLYRKLPGSPLHSVKMEADFEAPLEHLLAMAVEYDLTPTWHQYVKESLILATSHNPWSQLVYGCLWTPLVLLTAHVYCRGFDLSQEHDCVLLTLEDGAGVAAPPGAPAPKKRRMAHTGVVGRGSCLRMEPLAPAPDGRARTRAGLVLHLDPRFKYIPHKLVSWVLTIMAPYAYKAVQKVLREVYADPNSALNRRLAAAPHLYARCRARCSEVVARKAAQAAEE